MNNWDDRLDSGNNSFDALRLLLATLVVFEHSYFLIDGSVVRDPLFVLSRGQTNCGQLAVFMFFSISGFLVTRSRVLSSSITSYLKKRIARIAPGFFAAVAFGCLTRTLDCKRWQFVLRPAKLEGNLNQRYCA